MSSNNKQFDLTIVIPALNEEKRIVKTLSKLNDFLSNDFTMNKLCCEVIIVSADSNDNTHFLINKITKNLNNYRSIFPGKKIGKGRDVRIGMLAASGRNIVYMDADLATPLYYLPMFIKLIEKGNDIVIATRNLRTHHPNIIRRILSNTGNFAFRLLGGVSVEDSQCGFKMFSTKAAKICFSRQTIMYWGFDMEILTIAKIRKLKLCCVRINDWQHVKYGTFHESQVIANALSTLKDLLYIFLNRLLGVYKK